MNFQFNNGVLTIVVNGRAFTVRSDHPNFGKIKEAKNGDEEAFVKLVDVEKSINDKFCGSTSGRVTLANGEILFNDKPLHNSLTKRILELARTDLPVDGMLKFLENLLVGNPSKRAVDEGFEFLAKEALPVTDDGCFLAYKTVKGDYFSKTGGSLTLLQGVTDDNGHIDNHVGQVIECLRNEVDDVADRTCSHGLHVGALEYAGPEGWFHNSGDRCVIVKVNPADMVSVPSDHNANKLRVCKYEVVGEYVSPLNKPVYEREDSYEYDDEYEEDDYEEETGYLYADDLEYGMNIKFTYQGKTRTVSVDHVDGHLMTGMLLTPEAFAGEYRNFTLDEMLDIEYA